MASNQSRYIQAPKSEEEKQKVKGKATDSEYVLAPADGHNKSKASTSPGPTSHPSITSNKSSHEGREIQATKPEEKEQVKEKPIVNEADEEINQDALIPTTESDEDIDDDVLAPNDPNKFFVSASSTSHFASAKEEMLTELGGAASKKKTDMDKWKLPDGADRNSDPRDEEE